MSEFSIRDLSSNLKHVLDPLQTTQRCSQCMYATAKRRRMSQDVQLLDDEWPSIDDPSPSFIDHTSYFNCAPSRINTPLLDRMKTSYSSMCKVRRLGEMSTCSEELNNDHSNSKEMILVPAKYTIIEPHSRVFFGAMMDFARWAFDDIRSLSREGQTYVGSLNFRLVLTLDACYRAWHYFPTDDTVMESYSTYVNDYTMKEFVGDCPSEIDKKLAIEKLKSNRKRIVNIFKSAFRQVIPSMEEFIALYGLAFWNEDSTVMNPDLIKIARRNREAIVNDLFIVYTRNGMKQHEKRLGELLCLLANIEKVGDLIDDDLQVYRMMNCLIYSGEDSKE